MTRARTAACSVPADPARKAWQGPLRRALHAPADVRGLTATMTDFRKIVLNTCRCSSRATFLFYLAVLASSILCAASRASAPRKLNPVQADIAFAAKDVEDVSRAVVVPGALMQAATAMNVAGSFSVALTNGENRRSSAPGAADDLAVKFASPLTGASQL